MLLLVFFHLFLKLLPLISYLALPFYLELESVDAMYEIWTESFLFTFEKELKDDVLIRKLFKFQGHAKSMSLSPAHFL